MYSSPTLYAFLFIDGFLFGWEKGFYLFGLFVHVVGVVGLLCKYGLFYFNGQGFYKFFM